MGKVISRLLKLVPSGSEIEFQSYFEHLKNVPTGLGDTHRGFADLYSIDLPTHRGFPRKPYSEITWPDKWPDKSHDKNCKNLVEEVDVPGLEIERLVADVEELALTDDNKQYVSRRARILGGDKKVIRWEESGVIPRFQDYVRNLGLENLKTSVASATNYRQGPGGVTKAPENIYCAIVRATKK